LSPEIAGKDILLVDDIYTPTCGIDEDAASALFEAGAQSVVFYAVGHTILRSSMNLNSASIMI
jgi:phosphoribosylpyrophosphate synthetase